MVAPTGAPGYTSKRTGGNGARIGSSMMEAPGPQSLHASTAKQPRASAQLEGTSWRAPRHGPDEAFEDSSLGAFGDSSLGAFGDSWRIPVMKSAARLPREQTRSPIKSPTKPPARERTSTRQLSPDTDFLTRLQIAEERDASTAASLVALLEQIATLKEQVQAAQACNDCAALVAAEAQILKLETAGPDATRRRLECSSIAWRPSWPSPPA